MSGIGQVLVSVVFDGVSFAMVLFIISVGLSVTMGLMGVVNLAHGAFAMVGGYVLVTLMNRAGIPFFPALLLAVLAAGLLSVPLERLLYRRLYGAPELDQVLMTIGLVFVAVAAATLIWGPLNVRLQTPDYLAGQIDFGFRKFPAYRTFLNLVGLAIVIAVWFGLERTQVGARIRAAVDDRAMAQSVGIDTERLFTVTFAVGSALAALGGALGIEVLQLTPTYALEYLVYFLIVVAVGGTASVRGTLFAALLLGIFDNAGKYFLPQFGSFFFFALTIVVLLVRPRGLFVRS
jgi:branched-chain amino acid transport system permease protein